FLYGFIPAVWIGASLLNKGVATKLWRVYAAAYITMPCYFCLGIVHCALVMHISLPQAIIISALPFLIIDALKILIFTPLIWRIRRLLHLQSPKLF
ncbi:MAG: biotin transporter BioY, partial [Firmicutes bacterium]|nr:biotin transporter BioY [Bacillota bacterium]